VGRADRAPLAIRASNGACEMRFGVHACSDIRACRLPMMRLMAVCSLGGRGGAVTGMMRHAH